MPADPAELVLLPEMDGKHDVPEITTRCWAILKKSPGDMMCASSRMVDQAPGGGAADRACPCTLIACDRAFEMGLHAWRTASRGRRRHVRTAGAIKLCHPHCSKFCVLGRRQLLGALTTS